MYYTVSKVEFDGIKVGAFFEVRKMFDGKVLARLVKFSNDSSEKGPLLVPTGKDYKLTVTEARRLFTKPSQDIGFLMEESAMLCEAQYC